MASAVAAFAGNGGNRQGGRFRDPEERKRAEADAKAGIQAPARDE
jgi:hypothetical protein